MAAGVLQGVALSYQLLWNAQRQVAGVRINLNVLPKHSVDAAQFLTTFQSVWHPKSPALLLSTSDAQMLNEFLPLDLGSQVQLMVPAELLNDAALTLQVKRARQRGSQLVWQGQPGQSPLPAQTIHFSQQVTSLSPEQALLALRASNLRPHGGAARSQAQTSSPVHANQIVDNIPSQVLAKHCLDERQVSAVIGWPMDDVLFANRKARIQPSTSTLHSVLEAIEVNASMEQVEQQLGQDPVLAYRFLCYVNSAGLGLDRAIDSLRHGLTVLGLSRTAKWLRELAPHASQDADLEPIRRGLALRARFMSLLLDAGEGDALRRELYLCGLLSPIDRLTGANMASTLHAIALPSSISEALLYQKGPYWPFLAMANALENPYPIPPHTLCARHDLDLEVVNMSLLRSLAELRAP